MKTTNHMENPIMYATNLMTEKHSRPRLNCMPTLAVLALLVVGSCQLGLAQKSGPETFSSPWKATRRSVSSRPK